jgi:hypothetical protein
MNADLQNLITIKSGSKSIPEEKFRNQIKLKLYPHQLETVQRMMEIEKGNNHKNNIHSSFGILADPVGSGKTLEVLSLIAADPKLKSRKATKINGSNKRIVVTDRIIYEIDIPYVHDTEFVFNKNNNSRIYGPNNFLSSISYSYYNTKAKTPANWPFTLVNTNIIVVPHNVISHWRTTAQKQTKLKHKIITKTVDLPKHITELDGYDVTIISAPRLKDFMNTYLKNMYDDDKHYYVHRYIVDEAHTYKGRFSLHWKDENKRFAGIFKVNSTFVWWMSSSFASLFAYNSCINVMTPLLTMYNDCGSDIISNLTVKHNQDDISESIKLPAKYYYKIYSELSEMWQAVVSNFRSILTTEALAAINANDYEEAINRLGIEEIAPEDLLNAMTQKMQDEIDNLQILLKAKSKMKYKSESYKKNALQKLKDDIKEKQHKLDSIVNSLENGDDCPICYSEPDETQALLQCCYKKVCLECLVTYFTQKFECPSCAKESPKYVSVGKHKLKKDKKAKKDNEEKDDKDSEDNLDFDTKKELLKWIPTNKKIKASKFLGELCDKSHTKENHFESICNLLNLNKEQPSMLIFSSYDGTFRSCKATLKKYNMGYKEIKGTPDQINKTVENYNKKELSCLMLNSKHMGFGMNLQTTSDIVIMHKMDPEMENQVIGRAYRIGKTTPLRIWYIYHSTEDEDDN